MVNSEKRINDLTGKEWLQNSFSIWRNFTKTVEERQYKHPASFPLSLCEKLIRTFSKEGSTVIDPFNGIGSTSTACFNLGRECVGIDLSADFCNIAKSRIPVSSNIEIINGNSLDELSKLEVNSYDLCITSPPYWDILNMKRSVDGKIPANYSDSSDDLGNIRDYEVFLSQLENIFSKLYKLMKPNSYSIINVMDIRKQNKFFPFHSDIASIMQNIGFVYDDIIIWDRQNEYNNMRPLGYPYRFRINKVHEYLLIFIK